MPKHQKKAFTLVELIVVITILAILGTIAFISLQGYSKQARDSRRVSDISNIKKSLELFSLNTGKYPVPDDYSTMSYSGETLFLQGVIGDGVTQNLSENLQEKPTDPLHEIEYIYSTTDSRKEYEVLAFYEATVSSSPLLRSRGTGDEIYAANQYKIKVSGNYNGIYVNTTSYIVPTPSIISSGDLPIDLNVTPASIGSMIITGGDNFPNIGLPGTEQKTTGLDINFAYAPKIDKTSDDNAKLDVINAIQTTYSGTTLASSALYVNVLSKTTDQEKIAYVEDIILNNGKTGTSTNTSSCDTEPSYTNATFTAGTPTQSNQAWQSSDSQAACYYECNLGYTGVDCSTAILYSSCKEILDNGLSTGDKVYTIDPENNGTGFQVYCDMTTDGGGWTLVGENYDGGMNISSSVSSVGLDPEGLDEWKLSDSMINTIKESTSTSTNGYRINYDGLQNKYFWASACPFNSTISSLGSEHCNDWSVNHTQVATYDGGDTSIWYGLTRRIGNRGNNGWSMPSENYIYKCHDQAYIYGECSEWYGTASSTYTSNPGTNLWVR